VAMAKWAANEEGPNTLSPINPQSATFANDIEKSFATMEKTVELEYAKLTAEAKADLLATYERIKVLERRNASLKAEKEKLEQQITKLQSSKSNNAKI